MTKLARIKTNRNPALQYFKSWKLMRIVLFALSASALGVAGAQATTKHMKTGKLTSQPIGHAYFCQQFPQKCRVKSKDTTRPTLTKKRWKELLAVNSRTNSSVEPVTDLDLYGVEEHWTYPQKYGDCEDYVLMKRYLLLKKGWPESSLLITVVKQDTGEGHAVLTVRTHMGDFILDNLETRIERWYDTNYKFLKRQSENHSGKWRDIKDRRDQVAGY